MATRTPVSPATAAEVRAFVAALEGVELSEAAKKNLTAKAGRVHPEVVQAHNSRVSPARRYKEGAVSTVTLSYRRVTQSGSRTALVSLPMGEIRDLAARGGAEVGQRGRLSAAALKAAGEQFEKDRQLALTI